MEKNYKKELTLKANSVKRLLKEYKSYENEVTKLQAKYQELKSSGSDEYQLNKQNEYVQESISCRDIVKPKLRNYTDELINYLNDVPEDVKSLEEYKTAVEILESAKTAFEQI